MPKKTMVAMILAGGKGTRLESLTRKNAKPAVFYGGKYRIIDFVLSNVANSNINSGRQHHQCPDRVSGGRI